MAGLKDSDREVAISPRALILPAVSRCHLCLCSWLPEASALSHCYSVLQDRRRAPGEYEPRKHNAFAQPDAKVLLQTYKRHLDLPPTQCAREWSQIAQRAYRNQNK